MGTITPIYQNNFVADPPVEWLGQGYNAAVNNTLDLRNAFSAYLFVQIVNHSRIDTSLPDSGLMMRIKRHSMSGGSDLDYLSRAGEIVRFLDPKSEASTVLTIAASSGSTSITCQSVVGFDPDPRFPAESNICLYNTYYQNNFEVARISGILTATNVINLDSSLSLPHYVDGHGADVVHLNAMCLDPIKLLGGAEWDINFVCNTPANNVYWIKWFAQLYLNDTYNP